jgi:glutathione S-transferase
MPFQQVPVLQLEDGHMLAQMAAIGEHQQAS